MPLPGYSKIEERKAPPPDGASRSVKSAGKRVNKVALGVLTGFCLVVFGGYLLWANQPLTLAERDRTLPEPNGFVLALDAASRLTPSANGSPLANRGFTDPKVLREKLAPDQRNRDDLRKSLVLKWGIPPVQDNTQKFPYLPAFREGARQFAAESRVAVAEGRPGEAIERALDAVELGSRMSKGAPLIHYFVALSASAIGTDQADRVVPTLSAGQARAAGARLDRILARFPPVVDAFQEERWLTLSTLLRVYRGELDLRAVTSEAGVERRPASGAPWYLFLYPKPQTFRALDRWFSAQMAEAEKPYSERRPVPVPGDFLALTLTPFLDRSLLAAEKNRAALRILRVELALQEYRGRRGAYPEALAALAPAILPVVPDDPYSGQPFRYLTGHGGYKLYSVGPNLKDDGGTPVSGDYTLPNAEGDLVAGQLGYRKKGAKP